MRLHEQATHFKAKAAALESELEALLSYVQSDKYRQDNQCNVMDIILRINEGKRNIQTQYTDFE